MRKGSSSIILLLLILGLAVAGFVSYKKGYLKVVIPVATPSPGPEVSTVWNKYNNTKYGYSISYPGSFFYRDIPVVSEPLLISKIQFAEKKYEGQEYNYPVIYVNVYKSTLTPKNFVDENGTTASVIDPNNRDPKNYLYNGVGFEEDLNIAGLSALRFQSANVSTGTTHTLFSNNGYIYDVGNFVTGVGEIPAGIYDQILSTFTLTK